jgi:hypothetical protein
MIISANCLAKSLVETGRRLTQLIGLYAGLHGKVDDLASDLTGGVWDCVKDIGSIADGLYNYYETKVCGCACSFCMDHPLSRVVIFRAQTGLMTSERWPRQCCSASTLPRTFPLLAGLRYDS